MRASGSGLAYCSGPLKRGFDLTFALMALVFLAPVLLFLALLVLLSSGPPAFFVQERVGLGGCSFRLLKFRSMHRSVDQGVPLTAQGDRRVTGFGRFLRMSKLDELPQLLNVVKGEMSLVGPRPEVARYVETYTARQKKVLEVRPGLTDWASIAFRNEESLLGAVPEGDKERYYLESILPKKLEMNLAYIAHAGLGHDLQIIGRTIAATLAPGKS